MSEVYRSIPDSDLEDANGGFAWLPAIVAGIGVYVAANELYKACKEFKSGWDSAGTAR